MAKVLVEFDTKSKEFMVSIDGKSLENVTYCSFSPNYEGEWSFMASTKTEDEDNDMHKYEMLQASKVENLDKLYSDIQKFLSK